MRAYLAAGTALLTPAQAKREAETLTKRKLYERRRVFVTYTRKSVCTWCLVEVTGRRSTWCSDACVGEFFQVNDWKRVREMVLARDAGVCRHCKRDTQKAQRVHREIVRHAMSFHYPDRKYHFSDSVYPLRKATNPRVVRWRDLAIRLAAHCGFGPAQRTDRDWWEADHIIERVRGGRDHLDNLRTLCLRCHKVETARLARERADERRARIPLAMETADG